MTTIWKRQGCECEHIISIWDCVQEGSHAFYFCNEWLNVSMSLQRSLPFFEYPSVINTYSRVPQRYVSYMPSNTYKLSNKNSGEAVHYFMSNMWSKKQKANKNQMEAQQLLESDTFESRESFTQPDSSKPFTSQKSFRGKSTYENGSYAEFGKKALWKSVSETLHSQEYSYLITQCKEKTWRGHRVILCLL